MTQALLATPEEIATAALAGRRRSLLLDAVRQWRGCIGLIVVAALVGVALLGPLLAPYSPTEFVGIPNIKPSGDALFGTDSIGRDVWTRWLHGGFTVIGLSLIATLFGVGCGLVIGLVAAYVGGRVDSLLMRTMDVFLAFPQIVLVLLLVSAFGSNQWLVAAAVGATHTPRVARVLRGAALQVVRRDFVQAAEAVGESRMRIVLGQVLPNISSTVLVESGLRLTFSIATIAGINFLGVGLQPPTADWGLMVNENFLSISVQPWGVILPVLAIALLSIGINLFTDAVARAALGIERKV